MSIVLVFKETHMHPVLRDSDFAPKWFVLAPYLQLSVRDNTATATEGGPQLTDHSSPQEGRQRTKVGGAPPLLCTQPLALSHPAAFAPGDWNTEPGSL